MHIQWFAFLLALYSATTFASEPSQEPRLAIEAGMHAAVFKHIDVSRDGKVAITASEDKTARLWELPSGRLLRILRPPTGTDGEGMLYTCALSPDGLVAAVGGYTGQQWTKGYCVYLFDTATGRLLRTLPDLPTGVYQLSFSHDGTLLAGITGSGGGLIVWDARTWEEVARDFSYGDQDSYSVAWDRGNRLVTTCMDDHIRLYEVNKGRLRLVMQRVIQAGAHPCSARFSPDASRIAVGFANSPSVVILKREDLSILTVAETDPVGHQIHVTWNHDGTALAAGGTWNKHPKFDKWPKSRPTKAKMLAIAEQIPMAEYIIRQWPLSGRGKPIDSLAGEGNIGDLRPLPNGDILFVGDSWGWVTADGQTKVPVASPLGDFRAPAGSRFPVSSDGTTVSFCFRPFGEPPVVFSLAARALEPLRDFQSKEILKLPKTHGLKIDNWDGGWPTEESNRVTPPGLKIDTRNPNGVSPTLNGRPLNFISGHLPRSLAIASNNAFFILGSNFTLARYSRRGAILWRILAPGAAHEVNLTAFDKVIVGAFGDGTIRWYRASDGGELLAFFPHSDRKRWVLWTPEGYYDASPGAEDLIGWHLNRSQHQAADFFPASRFRAVYYRPDVIQRVLKTLDTTAALRQANFALGRPLADPESIREVIARLSPPVVELSSGGVLGEVTVSKNAHSVGVRYRVRQTGHERPSKVSIRFNGRPVDVDAALPPDGKEAEVEVPLPEGVEGDVAIIAEHKFGTSQAAIVRVRRENGPQPARRPDLYVIACGVAHLQANEAPRDGTVASVRKQGVRKDAEGRLSFDDLLFAGDDARKFAGLFGGQEGKAYAHVIPTVLVDKQATTAAIVGALNDVKRKAQPGDVVVVFFSGHGHFIPDPGFLLITHDTNPQNLAATALTGQELARRLAEFRASVVLALDTCYSGAALEGDKQVRAVTGPGDLTGLVNQLSSSEQGVVVISSSAENQSSFEDDREKQGVFTKAVAEGFAGGAVQDGQITCASLQKWIVERVPVLAKRIDAKAEQYPSCIMPKGVPDFALAKP